MLLFSGASVWPWQLLETELSHHARARATGNILLSISTTQPANTQDASVDKGRKAEEQGFFFPPSFIHQYAFELPCLPSQSTMDLGFLRLWVTTTKQTASDPTYFQHSYLYNCKTRDEKETDFISHAGRALSCYIQNFFCSALNAIICTHR